MKQITFTIIIIITSICATFAQVRQGAFAIKGRLVDSASHKPAEFVTIALINANKQPVKATLSKTDGSFLADKLPGGKLTVSFAMVGYITKKMEISLDDSTKPLDLGEISISASNTTLKAVSIKANRPVIVHEADKLAYDIQADPDSKSSNVLEMMRKVPLLTVDADDNIQLSGNSAYRIFINGKPSSLMERDPKNVLKSMPAASIQKIEVITTPGSKYDAEGLAGIINIITNKAVDNGYNGNININERFPSGGPSIGGSFATKSGKLGVSAFGGGAYNNNPATTGNLSRIGTNNTSTLFQTSGRASDGRNAYLGTELSYEVDTLNLISAQFNLNGSNGGSNAFQNSVSNAATLQRYDLATGNHNSGRGGDAALNYQKGFHRHKNQLLTISYRYYGFANDQNALQLFSNRTNYALPDFRQMNKSTMNEQTAQIDYVHPVKKLNIEAGVKGIYRTNKSDFNYLSRDASGNYTADPTKTNTFDNKQTILAAYNSYQYNAGKWSVKGGVRVENTMVNADFVSTASQVKQNYFTLVPSVAFSRRFKSSGISLGWNQRIQRPGINQLNPFVDRSNPTFESSGNPDLRPTTGNQLRLGYDHTGKGNLNVNLSYNWINGLIFPVSNYDQTTGITRTTYQNTGGAKALGGNVNFNYPITKIWNVSANGNIMHGWADGISNGEPIKNSGFMYQLNVSTNMRIVNSWRLSSSAYLNGGQLTVQQRSNAFVTTSLNVSRDIIKDKLTFAAYTNNPFSRYRNNVTHAFGPNFDQVSTDQQNFSAFGASLSYRFGKLKEAIKKNKRGINNDDVSNN